MSLPNQKLDSQQRLLLKLVEQSPEDWSMRKRVVDLLVEAEYFEEASEILEEAPEIPETRDATLFVAKVYSRSRPDLAIEMIDRMVSQGADNASHILEMAKLMAHAGMPLQAIRYYGAATAFQPSLSDTAFENYLVEAEREKKNWREAVQSTLFPWGAAPYERQPEVGTRPDVVLTREEAKPQPISAVAEDRILPMHGQSSQTQVVAPPEPESEPELAAPPAPPEPKQQEAEALQSSAEPPKPQISEENPGFFKSYDDAHEHKMETAQPQSEPASQSLVAAEATEAVEVEAPEPPQAPQISEVSDVPDVAEQPPATPSAEVKVEETTPADDLDDISAALERERLESQEQVQEESKPGMFSSVMGMFRRGSKKEEVEDELPPLDDEEVFMDAKVDEPAEPETQSEAEVVASTPAPVENQPVAEVPQPATTPLASVQPAVAEAPASAPLESVEETPAAAEDEIPQKQTAAQRATPMQPVSSTQVLVSKPPADDVYQPPEELDDKTQLVTLTPADGQTYFNQLIERYRSVPEGMVPRPVQIAAQMANTDYLSLIGEACNKNLDAFSKLLGLHRIMSDVDCVEWVSDMDLLRRGYGDAVLATVVSKYSPEECREILNRVYQAPRPTAAMAAG